MTDAPESRNVEENVARLLASALDREARPDPRARQRAFERVRAEMRTHRAAIPFPDTVVALLGGLLACAVAGLGLLAASAPVPVGSNPALLLLSAAVSLNLILTPIAGAVIVFGRQREQS